MRNVDADVQLPVSDAYDKGYGYNNNLDVDIDVIVITILCLQIGHGNRQYVILMSYFI